MRIVLENIYQHIYVKLSVSIKGVVYHLKFFPAIMQDAIF